MAHRDTSVSALCRELAIRPVTLYRYVGPQGQLREQGQKVLGLLNEPDTLPPGMADRMAENAARRPGAGPGSGTPAPSTTSSR